MGQDSLDYFFPLKLKPMLFSFCAHPCLFFPLTAIELSYNLRERYMYTAEHPEKKKRSKNLLLFNGQKFSGQKVTYFAGTVPLSQQKVYLFFTTLLVHRNCIKLLQPKYPLIQSFHHPPLYTAFFSKNEIKAFDLFLYGNTPTQ